MQQNCTNGIKHKVRLVGKGDLLGIVQDVKIQAY